LVFLLFEGDSFNEVLTTFMPTEMDIFKKYVYFPGNTLW